MPGRRRAAATVALVLGAYLSVQLSAAMRRGSSRTSAACAFGGLTLLAGRVGAASSGYGGLVLSVTVAALVLAPFSVAAAPRVSAHDWPLLAASAVIGVAIAFSLTFTAARLTTPRVIGTRFAADPAVGALVGAVLLGQTLGPAVLLGIGLVVVSGAAVSWIAGSRREQELVADRVGRPRDDAFVRALAGAIIGVAISASRRWSVAPRS